MDFIKKTQMVQKHLQKHVKKNTTEKKWLAFFTITFSYTFYYVTRLSFSVAKKSMVDAGSLMLPN